MVFSSGMPGGKPPLPVLAILADPRGVAERSPSKDVLYPLCGWAQPIFESEQYSAWVLATERLSDGYGTFFRRSIVTSPSIYVDEKEPWQGNVPLPTPLTALGNCLPRRAPLEVIEAERHTYYWYDAKRVRIVLVCCLLFLPHKSDHLPTHPFDLSKVPSIDRERLQLCPAVRGGQCSGGAAPPVRPAWLFRAASVLYGRGARGRESGHRAILLQRGPPNLYNAWHCLPRWHCSRLVIR